MFKKAFGAVAALFVTVALLAPAPAQALPMRGGIDVEYVCGGVGDTSNTFSVYNPATVDRIVSWTYSSPIEGRVARRIEATGRVTVPAGETVSFDVGARTAETVGWRITAADVAGTGGEKVDVPSDDACAA